ncbi:MAG: XRE family transcriptional regulator, partial [Proteobacteria bacterium]
LTQRSVSLSLGYSSAQFISNFERGIAAPPLKKLKILARLYKMPTDRVVDLVIEAERAILEGALRS